MKPPLPWSRQAVLCVAASLQVRLPIFENRRRCPRICGAPAGGMHECLSVQGAGAIRQCAGALMILAVTRGPGLLGSLLVGTTAARALAAVWQKPLIAVHHTFGHLSSTWLQDGVTAVQPRFQYLPCLFPAVISDLWYRTTHTSGQRIGTTRDDAAGEAFDKGATLLGLPYPWRSIACQTG